MAIIRCHSHNVCFTIHVSPRHPDQPPSNSGMRRAAIRWLADRLPAELVSLSYDSRKGEIRVELVSRVEVTQDDWAVYTDVLPMLLGDYLRSLDPQREQDELFKRRVELEKAIAEHPHGKRVREVRAEKRAEATP